MNAEKKSVHDFWQKASCGESLYLKSYGKEEYLRQTNIRYDLEPFIPTFAQFENYKGKKVLEIGIGLGADHQKFAEAGAVLYGIDFTNRSVEHVHRRFQHFGLHSMLGVADAEDLPFNEGTFDLVYSWGVLHHTPNTAKAVHEMCRVLKPGGEAKIMIYHKYSFVGYMLWLRYALFKFRPGMTLAQIYNRYLESPGTKAYSMGEAKVLFKEFCDVNISTVLTHGDLLASSVGQRHQGRLLSLARLLWPRRIIRRFFYKHGLYMLINANK